MNSESGFHGDGPFDKMQTDKQASKKQQYKQTYPDIQPVIRTTL
jgi:hypothetical protein